MASDWASAARPDHRWSFRLRYRLDDRLGSVSSAAHQPRGVFRGETASRVVVLLVNLLVAATIVTIFSARTAAGEEIGLAWVYANYGDRCRGAGTDSGQWFDLGTWHVPLILGGVYLAGPPPALAALLWMRHGYGIELCVRKAAVRPAAFGQQ